MNIILEINNDIIIVEDIFKIGGGLCFGSGLAC